jgi:hypothetical protein
MTSFSGKDYSFGIEVRVRYYTVEMVQSKICEMWDIHQQEVIERFSWLLRIL